MKLTTSLKAALLAMAGVAILAPSAKAALTYTDGDLILGFNVSGGTGAGNTYVVDLGAFTQFSLGGVFHTGSLITFDSATKVTVNGTQVSLNGIGADLLSNFGDGSTNSSWNTRTDLFFGVAGTQKTAGNGVANNTDFASKAEITNGTQSAAWSSINTSTASGAATKIHAAGNVYAAGSATGNNTVGSIAASSNTTNPNNFAAYQPTANGGANGTQSFNVWNGGIEAAVGNSNNVIDLYKLAPSTAAVYVGSFDINSSGQLQFQSSPIPEPGSISMLGVGSLSLLAFLRRRSTKPVNA